MIEVLNQDSCIASLKDCTGADLKKLIPCSLLNSMVSISSMISNFEDL